MTRYFKEYLEREGLKLHGEPSRVLGRKLSKLGINKKKVFQQPYSYEIPPLHEVRKNFEENVKGEIDWNS